MWPCCSLSFSMSQYPIYSHTHTREHICTHTHTSPYVSHMLNATPYYTYTQTHTHIKTHTHTIPFTFGIKLVHSHILLHLHTRSFSQSCSHLHAVYFQQIQRYTYSCTGDNFIPKHRLINTYTCTCTQSDCSWSPGCCPTAVP